MREAAVKAPKKTVFRECFIAMMAVTMKVLSPISDAKMTNIPEMTPLSERPARVEGPVMIRGLYYNLL